MRVVVDDLAASAVEHGTRRERTLIDRGEVVHGSWGIVNIVGQRLHWNKKMSRERPGVQLVQVLEPKFSPDLPRGGVGLALEAATVRHQCFRSLS